MHPELGSGDFLLVNQSDETATDALLRFIEAQARNASARAELAAAIADRMALDLDGRACRVMGQNR